MALGTLLVSRSAKERGFIPTYQSTNCFARGLGLPRFARTRQLWAEGRNPVGVGGRTYCVPRV